MRLTHGCQQQPAKTGRSANFRIGAGLTGPRACAARGFIAQALAVLLCGQRPRSFVIVPRKHPSRRAAKCRVTSHMAFMTVWQRRLPNACCIWRVHSKTFDQKYTGKKVSRLEAEYATDSEGLIGSGTCAKMAVAVIEFARNVPQQNARFLLLFCLKIPRITPLLEDLSP